MDLSKTIIPKSDQINFEDVQSSSITAVIKSIRAGNSEQPVFIDLDGYDGRPYKPSKSMRRVLIGGWGSDGHSWVGKTLTLVGDPSVKFGGVAVGGIKVSAMSDIDADMSLMLTTSRGRRSEHRVKKLVVSRPQTKKVSDPQSVLAWFAEEAGKMDLPKLTEAFARGEKALSAHPEHLLKLTDMYGIRKAELEA
ncbi:MAG: hypothetical protein EKE20_16920 [Candidatus Symbiopectobacterium sp. Dall1.0]|nr:hypothetical protein [Candidatus Symbiopectobacterium sp. Dall1.0]